MIINPNSGPGDIPSPDPNYAREVARLNSYPNVYLIGYIRIDYCRKPLPETLAEIDRYAHWATDERPGLGLGGIMVDETPNHHTAERAEYLQKLHEYVKSVEGILRDRLVSISSHCILHRPLRTVLVCLPVCTSRIHDP